MSHSSWWLKLYRKPACQSPSGGVIRSAPTVTGPNRHQEGYTPLASGGPLSVMTRDHSVGGKMADSKPWVTSTALGSGASQVTFTEFWSLEIHDCTMRGEKAISMRTTLHI